MSLRKKIQESMIQAMKAKQEVRLNTIRMIRSAIKNQEIEKKAELTDAEIAGVLRKLAKQRQDSIEQYEKASRQDLADKEKAEIVVLEEFLPPAMAEEDVMKVVDETAQEVGATSMKEMGKLMAALKEKLDGRVDGKTLSNLVKKKLS